MSNKLNEIDARVRAFADARTKLAEYVAVLNDGIEALRRDNLPRIRRAITRAAELQAQVEELVEDAPEHFAKPRTLVLHGIKVGFEKGKGRIEFNDADKVIKAIEKKLPELKDTLIKTTKKPVKAALTQLSVQDLKAIGCTVLEAGDRVVVRAVDTDVEKLVTALLKGSAVDEDEE